MRNAIDVHSQLLLLVLDLNGELAVRPLLEHILPRVHAARLDG